MNRTYDLFERLSDGQFLWRCSASGPESVLEALNALAQETRNECFAMDLSTRELPKRWSSRPLRGPSERLAKLVGGVAVIKVGAATETELKEKKARVEDAMHATRAAVEEGIVPGGGVALLRCIPALEKIKASEDEAIGVNIVKRALEEPVRQIAQNAGFEGAVVVGRIRDSKEDHFGFNAETGEYGDLVKMGVIDPAKVTRLALQNASSVAALMLTTEALVAEVREEEKKAAAAGAVPGGGMY